MSSDEKLKSRLQIVTRYRGVTRGKITKLCNKIASELPNISSLQSKMYASKLDDMKSALNKSDLEISDLCIGLRYTEEQLESLEEEEETYDNRISIALTSLSNLDLLPRPISDDVVEDSVGAPIAPNIVHHKLKLPEVPMPEFSNAKGENLHNFFKSFEAIISKHRLTSYEKFIYLRKQLSISSSPRVLIDSLDVDQHSYEVAKALLFEAFDSTNTSKYETISKLAKLKMSIGADPYVFIGELRTIIANFKSLEITCDDLIQFFTWNGLNREFQSHVTNITNKFRPSLEEINLSLFEATDRYKKHLDKPKDIFISKHYSYP